MVFDTINMALAWHPPALYEVEAMAAFVRIGVIPGRRFSSAGLPAEVVQAVEAGVAEARAEIAKLADETGGGELVGAWLWATKDNSRFGRDYLTRAVIALRTIYPNAPDHAIYGLANQDLAGEPLQGENTYEMRFEAG